MNIKNIAKEVFNIEAKEISNLSNSITDSFVDAIKSILKVKGKLIGTVAKTANKRVLKTDREYRKKGS